MRAEAGAHAGVPCRGLGRASGVNRGTHTQLIAYHTIGAWGTGNDDVGLIQSTKAPPKPSAEPHSHADIQRSISKIKRHSKANFSTKLRLKLPRATLNHGASDSSGTLRRFSRCSCPLGGAPIFHQKSTCLTQLT